jgi:hypothetical protein
MIPGALRIGSKSLARWGPAKQPRFLALVLLLVPMMFALGVYFDGVQFGVLALMILGTTLSICAVAGIGFISRSRGPDLFDG